MKNYKARTLIDGYRVDLRFIGKKLVAVREMTGSIRVSHGNEFMFVSNWNEALHILEFDDKYGRSKKYRLGYFEWKPEEDKQIALFG